MSQFTFKDKEGTQWDLEITLDAARRIDQSDFTALTDQKFSFLNPDKDFFGIIIGNSPLCCCMAAIVLAPQMKAKMDLGYDPLTNWEQAESAFLARLNGTAIASLREAFLRALQDFFQDQKTVLSTLISQYSRAVEKMNLLVQNSEKEISQVMDAQMDRASKEFQNHLMNERERIGEPLTKSSASSDGNQEMKERSVSEDSSPSMTPIS